MGDEKPGAVRFLTDFSSGSRIAGYYLEEQIGHGGTAEPSCWVRAPALRAGNTTCSFDT
jgi:hypothetical protein